MRPSTTIRIDVETHERLRALASQMGMQMKDTVRIAIDTLERRRFFERLAGEVADTRAIDPALEGVRAESDELSVSDGLD